VNEEREIVGAGKEKRVGKLYVQMKFIPQGEIDDGTLGELIKDLGPVNSKK
jgi:hypothetical protein